MKAEHDKAQPSTNQQALCHSGEMSDFSDAEAQALRRAMATSFVDAQRAKPFAEGRRELRSAINTLIDRREIISREAEEAKLDYKRENLMVGDDYIASDQDIIGLLSSEAFSEHSREQFILNQEIHILSSGLGEMIVTNDVPYLEHLVGSGVVSTLKQPAGRNQIDLAEVQRDSLETLGMYDAAVGLTGGSDQRGLRDVQLSSLAPDRRRRAIDATAAFDKMVVSHIDFGERQAHRAAQENRALPPHGVLRHNQSKVFHLTREVGDPLGTMRVTVADGNLEPYRPHRFAVDAQAQRESVGPSVDLDRAVVARTILQEMGCSYSQAHSLSVTNSKSPQDFRPDGLTHVVAEISNALKQAEELGVRGDVAISGKQLAAWIDSAENSFPDKSGFGASSRGALPPTSLRRLQTGISRGLE